VGGGGGGRRLNRRPARAVVPRIAGRGSIKGFRHCRLAEAVFLKNGWMAQTVFNLSWLPNNGADLSVEHFWIKRGDR